MKKEKPVRPHTSSSSLLQPDLFDVGQRMTPETVAATRKHPPCTPDVLGTGPAGETCGSCAHLTRSYTGSGRYFLKCGLMRHRWTRGPGSDIRAKWAACSKWAPEDNAATREEEPVR